MLCSALRRAAVGWESFANVSCERIASFWPRNRVLARKGLFGRVSENRDLAFCDKDLRRASKPHLFVPERGFVSIFGRFFCTLAIEPMASGKPTRKGAAHLVRGFRKGGALVCGSAGEGLDDGRNPRLGWRGRKRAALLPARSETHRQSAPRRPGSSPARSSYDSLPSVVLPAGAIGGTPPPSTDPDPMGSSGGGDRYQVTLRRGCRPAIPHGSLPLSAPKVRMRCRWARVSGEGGASLRRMRGKSAARSRFSSQPACTFP